MQEPIEPQGGPEFTVIVDEQEPMVSRDSDENSS